MLPAPGLRIALRLLTLRKRNHLLELNCGDVEAAEGARSSERPAAGGAQGEGRRERAPGVLAEVGRQMAEPCALTCT